MAEQPKIRIQFKGGRAGAASGAHGQYQYAFGGAGPFDVTREEWESHLERTGLFEIAPEKSKGEKSQGAGGGSGGGEQQS